MGVRDGLNGFKGLVAASVVFQALCGVSSAAEALEFISIGGVRVWNRSMTPRLSIQTSGYSRARQGVGVWAEGGTIGFKLMLSMEPGASWDEEETALWGVIDGWIDEMEELSGVGTFFEADRFVVEKPVRADPREVEEGEEDLLIKVEGSVDWGNF